jgi:hypothetical protein
MFAALRKLRSNEAMRGINWEQNNLCDSRLESPQTLRSSATAAKLLSRLYSRITYGDTRIFVKASGEIKWLLT